MKFTSIPKKLVLTGMSAAMVVAFAPAVAQAEVNTTTPTSETVTTPVSGDTVATLTWVQNGKKYTQEFKSTEDKTNDDALQAALVKAAQVGKTKDNKATVTLAKSVKVGTLESDTQNKYQVPTEKIYNQYGLILAGDVTLDLGGNTISDAATGTEKDPQYSVVALESGQDNIVGKQANETTVYATSDQVAKTGQGGSVYKDGKDVTSYDGFAGGDSATQADASYYVCVSATWQQFSSESAAQAAAAIAKAASQGDGNIYKRYTVTWGAVDKAGVTYDNAGITKNDVTIVNGTIDSSVGTENAIRAYRGTLTLGKDAKVTSTKSAAAVNATPQSGYSADVVMKDGASVDATNAGAVTAIAAKDVSFGTDEDAKDPKVDNYKSIASVTATTTAATKDESNAKGVDATGTVTAYQTADVKASAGAKDSGESVTDHGEIGKNGTATVASTAVEAEKAVLNYGNYTADTAVKAGAQGSSIKYGTYTGYVDGGIDVSGGKFSVKPDANFGKATTANNVTTYALQKKNALGTNKVAQNPANSYWYVYRLGQATVTTSKDGNANAKDVNEFVSVSAPATAKDADGNAYNANNYANPVKSYVEDKFLNDYTKNLVFTEQGFGQKVNDGNTAAEGSIDVAVNAGYLTPTEKNAAALKFDDAYKALAAKAADQTQTAQGVYQLTAGTTYGTGAKKQDVEKSLSALTGAPLDVTAGQVQTNADAQGWNLGTNSEVTLTRPAAIGDDLHGHATFNTENTGYYGITVTTNKNAQDQAAKAQAEKDAKAAQPVIDAIAALPKAGDVDANNVSKASKAAASAQAGYDQLTADQKALVTNYATLGTVQAKVSKVSFAVAKAKAQTVKGLKVKTGKGSAKVSWKAVKGSTYQLKYRAKNSSKTSDFVYKAPKSAKATVKSLKKGKRYNFKVRTVKKVYNKTVYGKYTSIVTSGKIK